MNRKTLPKVKAAALTAAKKADIAARLRALPRHCVVVFDNGEEFADYEMERRDYGGWVDWDDIKKLIEELEKGDG